MIFNKLIEISIDVKDCIKFYTNDDNGLLFLKNRYEKRCFRGCYIMVINEIVKEGVCVINQHGAPSEGNIPFIVNATVIQYFPGEIINGCQVIKREKIPIPIIYCKKDETDIVINNEPILATLQPGQLISVRAIRASYSIGSNGIMLVSKFFVPSKDVEIYKINWNDVDYKAIEPTLDRIDEESMLLDGLRKDELWGRFEDVLYPFIEKHKNDDEVVDLYELMRNKKIVNKQFICQHPDHGYLMPTVSIYSDADDFIEQPSTAVIINLLENYCMHLRTMRELIQTYSTNEVIIANKNIFQIIKKMKTEKIDSQ